MPADPFESKVKAFINANLLPAPPCRIVTGLSGGADSVALLAVLTALGYECTAAHCNYRLRGEESDRDMRHSGVIADALGVDLCIRKCDVEARRAATGESLEMACREIRYGWFAHLADTLGARAVAVGHHKEDSVETILINLLRGSGIGGLCGISPRNGIVIRPLLDCSRAEIEAYLRRRGLEWVDDSTNAGNDFLRNRLRNRVIPLLDETHPGASDAILRSGAFLRENRDFYRRAIARAAGRYTDATTGDIDVAALSLDPDAPLLLFEMLRGEGFSRRQTDDMLAAASRSGGLFVSGDIRRHLDHGILRGASAAAPTRSGAVDVTLMHDITDPVHIEITRHDVAEFRPEADPSVMYIDERALEGAPRWQLRPWRRGDRFEPYGLDGSKLVSDMMAGARFSAARKAATLILWRDDTPVWVIGLRASRHWNIGPSTVRYLRLQYHPGNT